MPKVLIVEDDIQITRSLQLNLKLDGFIVECASTIAEAEKVIATGDFDLLLLDVGLPDGTGLDLCQKVRERGHDMPILFLSARTDEATVVKGIRLGADDYIRKPFGVEELKVRMNKLLNGRQTSELKSLNFAGVVLDMARRTCTFEGQIVSLGRKELEILLVLVKSRGEVVAREKILASLQDLSLIHI